MSSKRRKPPYSSRTDVEKVKANWIKTRGLFDREDWSMSVVRAAVCVELAANLAIRRIERDAMKPEEIDVLLIECNGAARKFRDHILPHFSASDWKSDSKRLEKLRDKLVRTRNTIAHGGVFLNEEEATELIGVAHDIIVPLVNQFIDTFQLDQILTSRHLRNEGRATVTDESSSDQSSRY